MLERASVRTLTWLGIGVGALSLAAAPQPPAAVLANAPFDDGRTGAFVIEPAGSVRVVADPLQSGHGRVAQFTYTAAGAAGLARAALALHPPAGIWGGGATLEVAGDVLLPANTFNLRNPSIRRTLLQLRAPLDGQPADSTDAWATLEYTGGCELRLEWSHDGYWRGSDCRLASFEPGRWHRLALRATLNSAPDRADGVLELAVNDSVVFRDSTVRFTDPARRGTPSWQTVRIGATRVRPEVRGGFDLSDGDAIAEVRYWDNLRVRAESGSARRHL